MKDFKFISNDKDYRHLADKERYKELYEEVGSVDANKKIEFREEWMKYFKPLSNRTILELGAHNGPNLIHYARLGHKIVGVELSNTLINTFYKFVQEEKEEVREKITIHQSWIEDFISHEKFDYVLCTEILEHVINPVEILKIAEKCLLENGTIYISSPSSHWGNNTHVRGVPIADLKKWLDEANLSSIELWEEDNRTFCYARKKNVTRIIGLLRVRNEEFLIKDTLDHLANFCNGGVFVYDDCSTDNTVEICKIHPIVRSIIYGTEWDTMRERAEYENRAAVLKKAKEFATESDWFVYVDADERIEFEWEKIGKLPPDVIGVKMKLFDFYITEKDVKKRYDEREWLGPEYRSILMTFRNLPTLSFHNPDQREVELGTQGVILEEGYVKHYGKAVSVEQWESTCDYYSKYFPKYSEKWEKRKGKAIHSESDFGAALIKWAEKESLGFPLENVEIYRAVNQSQTVGKKLKILLTNHHLLDYTGSEVYTLTLTEQLLKYGYEVVVYSKYVDKIEGEFLKLNVPVVYHLEEIKDIHFDIAHVHHNINAAEIRCFFPNLPIVYLSHGVLPFLEQPSVFNLGITHYVAVSEEVKNNLVLNGVKENDISVVGNIIDTQKFSSFKTINSIPKKALVVSAKIGDEKKKQIEQACGYLGVECKFIGGRNGVVKREQIADLIVDADVVFSLGRGAIEAMLCERNVIVFDETGGDGLITPDNFDEIRKHNFSGRRFNKNFSTDELIVLLKDCPQNDVRYLKNKAYELFAAEKVIKKLTSIYKNAVEGFIKDDSIDFKMLEVFYKSLQDTRDYSKILSQRKLSANNVNSAKLISQKEILFKYDSKIERLLGGSADANRIDSQKQVACKKYDVLIPIYNAYDQVKVCIESVLRNTNSIHKIYLLDDASPDKNILPMLNAFAENDNRVIVVKGEKNLGFVGNMNVGFKLSQNDVIILNSDTEVTPNWIEKLNQCAQSNNQIGIVSPLSNNATILSVPEFNSSNKLPRDISVDKFAEIVESCSNKDYHELPTAVGFCMLIKREVLNKIGYFDEIFGLGYGEENDFCERAKEIGYKIVCCDNVYVHHYGEASFSSVDQISERRKANQLKLESKWPNYRKEIFGFCRANPLRPIQEKIYTAMNNHLNKSLPYVLNVIHSYNAPGGTELHTSDVMERIKDSFRFSIIYPVSMGLDYTDAKTKINKQGIREIQIAKENNLAVEYFNGMPGDLTSELIERNFVNFLQSGDYNIVHFQHLLNWSSLLLPIIAKKLNKKVILTLHDYYLMCPEFNMIFPETLSRCNKAFASSTDEECLYCLGSKRRRRIPQNAQPLSDYLFERHEIIKNIFNNSDLLISPSEFVKQKFISAYGEEVAHKIKVIPHGIHPLKKANRPKFEKYLYIGFLGNVTTIKGADILLALGKRLAGKDIRLEVFGNVAVEFSGLLKEIGIRIHGGYERERLHQLVKHIHLIIIPSIWDETFCLTLSEAMELGIPVVASDSGAMTERIIEGETGFLFKTGSVYDLENKLLQLLANTTLLEKVRENLSQLKIKTIDENAEDYREIYNTVLTSNKDTVINYSQHLGFNNDKVITTSIVVLTYNAIEYTKKFYQSLVDSNVEDYELIVIDNASTDGTIEYLKTHFVGTLNIVVFFNENNIGFPAAVNQGINEAKGKYIVIVNNDIVLTEGWLERLIEVAESDSRIGLVGPISNEVSGLQKDDNAKYKTIDDMHKYAAVVSEKNKGAVLQFPRIAFLCTLIKKEVIEKIGGLDERFTPGNYEDDDFCLRAQLAGYKTVIAKDVFIHHYGSKSFKANGGNAYQERLNINRQKFVDKWGGTPEEIWLQNKKVNPHQILYPISKNKFDEQFERARILLADKELDLALESFQNALENYYKVDQRKFQIEYQDLLDLTGNVALATGNSEIAKKYFEEELNLNPNSSPACLGLGQIFSAGEQYEAAKTMFEWAVKNDTENQQAVESLKEVNKLLGFEVEHNSLMVGNNG